MKLKNTDIDEDLLDLALIEESRAEEGEDISFEDYKEFRRIRAKNAFEKSNLIR